MIRLYCIGYNISLKISNVKLTFAINQARNFIKKLIKCKLLFHLDLIHNCNVKMFSKRSSVINSIYSGQQQFSYNCVRFVIDLPIE
jgi:hypothetical protein